jgi:hypothetical protein
MIRSVLPVHDLIPYNIITTHPTLLMRVAMRAATITREPTTLIEVDTLFAISLAVINIATFKGASPYHETNDHEGDNSTDR